MPRSHLRVEIRPAAASLPGRAAGHSGAKVAVTGSERRHAHRLPWPVSARSSRGPEAWRSAGPEVGSLVAARATGEWRQRGQRRWWRLGHGCWPQGGTDKEREREEMREKERKEKRKRKKMVRPTDESRVARS